MADVTMPDLAEAMRSTVRDLIHGLDAGQRDRALFGFDADFHRQWTYFPGERPGLRLGDLGAEQLEKALDLLRLVHSARGWSDAQIVITIEDVKHELLHQRTGQSGGHTHGHRLPYWLAILGDPAGGDPWAWRINGHHLLAQATVIGDRVSGLPHFFGASPATVLSGPHSGLRALPREEDLARELVLALQEDQRRTAVIAGVAPADIATRWDPVAALPQQQPNGISYARLDRLQRELFVALVRQYLDRATPVIADQAWNDITDAGLDNLAFGWAGPIEQGAGHYYAISGPSVLIEYDNTQDDANHIHSVWRDLRRDFAGDLLARHYAEAPHPGGSV